MRKRIVIAAMAAVVIGVVVFGYSLYVRRENSVEYHQGEYWQAFHGPQYLERVRDRLAAFIATPVNPLAREERRERRLVAHEKRLIKLGYLQERRFEVWAREPELVVLLLSRPDGGNLVRRPVPAAVRFITSESNEIVKVRTDGPFSVAIVAPATNMGKWEERLRRADRANNAIR